MTTFTGIHMLLSLFGIGSGLVVLLGRIIARALRYETALKANQFVLMVRGGPSERTSAGHA
jgi:hypothetical protein